MTPVRGTAVILVILAGLGRILGGSSKKPEAVPPKPSPKITEPAPIEPPPKPVIVQSPEKGLKWVDVPTTKPFNHGSPIVRDIESRLPAKHEYWNECPVTWVHEGTHYINGVLTKDSRKTQGLYLLNGKGVILECPDLTLAEIAAAVPQDQRRTIYQTYLVTQRQWWDDSPLYLLNEWVAYGNGTACRMSLNWTGKKRIDTVRFFLEMETYIQTMMKLAEKDPEYKGMEDLKIFVDWYGKKIRDLVGEADVEQARQQMMISK